MSWAIGFDSSWNRDIGYGVPATCDHPGCTEKIDRGLSYVCGGESYGGEHGCGLYFCADHLWYESRGDRSVQLCDKCRQGQKPFNPGPDVLEWISWKLGDESWQQWRDENPDEVAKLKAQSRQVGAQ